MLGPIELIVGLVTTLLVQIAKKAKGVPLDEKNKDAIMAVAMALSFVGRFGVALAMGELESPEFTEYLGLAAESIVAYFISYLTYKTSGLTGSNESDER